MQCKAGGGKINYSLILEKELDKIKQSGSVPKLLLHCCCAPCSSYVFEYLADFFDITAYFFNPNISPKEEYDFRAAELERLISVMPQAKNIKPVVEHYDNDVFESAVKGFENEPEGGKRCLICYRLRLEKAAQYAKKNGFDMFCTTLSISPLKNADALNRIGGAVGEKYGIKYLYSDFKKKEGYKRSCRLSEQYSLYRQNYCGCVYSKRGAGNQK